MVGVVVPFEFADEFDSLGVFFDVGVDLADVLDAFALEFVGFEFGVEQVAKSLEELSLIHI